MYNTHLFLQFLHLLLGSLLLVIILVFALVFNSTSKAAMSLTNDQELSVLIIQHLRLEWRPPQISKLLLDALRILGGVVESSVCRSRSIGVLDGDDEATFFIDTKLFLDLSDFGDSDLIR
jgi:hypothetical protein